MLLPDRMYRPSFERERTDPQDELSVRTDRFPSASAVTEAGAMVREVQRAPSGGTHAPPVD